MPANIANDTCILSRSKDLYQVPQVMIAMVSPREGKKRRGYEAHLSPRSSPPTRAPIAATGRLPPIRSLLSEIPDQNELKLSQLRTPMREDATGPRPAIPARFSPPPLSRRSHAQPISATTNGHARNHQYTEDKTSRRSIYDTKSTHQLPIHSGPPPTRNDHSAPSLAPAPVSPYGTPSTDPRWEYSNRDSHSLSTASTPYYSSPSGRSSSYAPPNEYRNGGSNYGGQYRDTQSAGPPTYQSLPRTYPPMPYSYPSAPPLTNGNYPAHHPYQNGYRHGPMQFESDDSSNQAPRRRRGNLPRDTTDMLKQWFADHLAHPYPTEDEKQMLCRQTGLQMTQISNWFINARRRRIPELVNQATAETRLRENSGESSGSSD